MSHDTAFLAVSCSVVFVCLVLVVRVTCFIKIKVKPHQKKDSLLLSVPRQLLWRNFMQKNVRAGDRCPLWLDSVS